MSDTSLIPAVDYGSRDYLSLLSDLVSQIPNFLPEWTSRSESDFGIVLLELFAYVGDILNYYLDRLASEAFLFTATQPQSVLNIAQMLDYQPLGSVGAAVTLQFTTATGSGAITIPAGTQVATVGTPTQAPIIFTTNVALTIPGTTSGPTYTGTVAATQGVAHTGEAVATSDGTPNQSYSLANSPVTQGSITIFVDEGAGPTAWLYAAHLIDYGPLDRVYTTAVNANGSTQIIFGDSANGKVPNAGSPITANYQVSVGSAGNVASGTIVQIETPIAGVISVTNPSGASGGSDPQSLSSIQQQAPASLRALNRAVAVGDFASLALQVAGVQLAAATLTTYQLVNLYLVPFGGGNPSAALVASVQNFLAGKVMANTTVTIQNPTYVAVNVTAAVTVYPNYGNTTTQTAVLNALQQILSLSSVNFGQPVSLGLLYSTILAVQGVRNVSITASYRQFLAQLTSPLSNGTPYTSLAVTPLPQAVKSGDSIVINPGGGSTQTVTANANAAVGATSISVTSFTANANYAAGTTVQDPTGVNDLAFLANEVPIAGTLSITTSGGLAGS